RGGPILPHPVLIRLPPLATTGIPPPARCRCISADVGVPVDVSVHVSIHVHATAPPIAIVPRCTPGSAPCNSPGEADAEGDHRRRVRVIRVPGIIDRRRIGRHVDDRRASWHYLN